MSGTGKNGGGQVNILVTFPMEKVKFAQLNYFIYEAQSGKCKSHGGQVGLFDTTGKAEFSLISTQDVTDK